MRWSVRYQLLVPLAALVLGSVGVSACTAAGVAQRTRHQVATRVGGVIRSLSEAHFPLTPPVLEQMKGLSGAEYYLSAGDRSAATLIGPPPATALPAAADQRDDKLGERITNDGATYLCRGVALRPPHPNAGHVLYVFYPEQQLNDELRAAAAPLWILGAGGSLAALALAVGVGQRLVGRIAELRRQTRRIADGDLRPMPLAARDDELRDLGRSVNEMAERLRQLQDSMQKSERLRLLGQVSGGLAHQLRNAVAGAKLAVQLHARGCAGGDAESLGVARRQLGRIESDLDRFLDLGRDHVRRRPCNIVELVDEAATLPRP